MGEPFLSEVKMISWNFAPKGWAFCNGQLLPINQNQALFSLLGTTYGGDGRQTFALPDLRGRTPIHAGAGFTQGEVGGQEAVTITISQLPTHIHPMNGISQDGTVQIPTGAFLAAAGAQPYHGATNLVAMDPASISSVGGSQPHENRQPFLVINFVIALQGVFPSQN
ncbi:phage tail protein [Bradyrhizobium diazoefficiens]|nr:phage tail protein [Bradyrhizobium diazoefficiens]MBR0850053.1 phage tail protein [Bradyrhizobium diazoefficiens]